MSCMAVSPRSAIVSFWLGLNMMTGLCPIPYFLVGRPDARIAGLPLSIVYCMALLISISLSLFAAYRDDTRRGYFADTDIAKPPNALLKEKTS